MAAAASTGRRSCGEPSVTTITVLTSVLVSAAIVIDCTATASLPLRAYCAIDSVMASTSVVPASAATKYTPCPGA